MKHIIIFSLLLIFIGCSTQNFATKKELDNFTYSLRQDINGVDKSNEKDITDIMVQISKLEAKVNKLEEQNKKLSSIKGSEIEKYGERITILENQIADLNVNLGKQQDNSYNTDYSANKNTKPLATWKGDGEKTTEPFTITKSPWVVAWSTKLSNDMNFCTFSVTVYDINGGQVSLIANTSQANNDISYVYQTGTFYLKISSLFATWLVGVFEGK